MTELIVTLILAHCDAKINKTYDVQDYKQDCYHYYANCMVDSKLDRPEDRLEACQRKSGDIME